MAHLVMIPSALFDSVYILKIAFVFSQFITMIFIFPKETSNDLPLGFIW